MTELQELVTLARAQLPNKLEAYEQLALRQLPQTRGLAYAIVGDPDAASSIAQDVLIRVLHALPKLESVESYPGWVRRITVNAARTHLARERREQDKRSLYAQEVEESYKEPDSDDRSFADYVDGLSLEERTIVSLKVVEDLEFAEIAQVVGIGLSAVKMRYYRALEKIKAAKFVDEP